MLHFREGVSWNEEGGKGPWLVAPPLAPLSLAGQSPGVLAALRRLGMEGGTEEALAEEVARKEGAWAVATFLLLLRQLEELRLLAFTLRSGSEALASLHPCSAWFELRPVELEPRQSYVLSRFAYQHRVAGSMVVESPRSHAVLRLEDVRAAGLCAALARPSTSSELVKTAPGMTAETVETFVCLLLATKLVVPVDGEGQTEEERSPQLVPWMFHDLLFHARSRMGRHAGFWGKTYPFRGRLPPLPAVRPPPERPGEIIRLHRPDLDAVLASDPPFTAVLERRRSVRVHGAEPITVEALGELLYRAARVRKRMPAGPDVSYEYSSRPYPSGGACYDLEIYLAVDRCRGLDPGLYHYDPDEHRLLRVAERTPAVQRLLTDAVSATLSPQTPQVLVCLASRFQRVSWAYEGISYSITLKNVGVLYQTFYLVAAAMGLACCAVGRADSDAFVQAAGTDYFAETTVGELMLGSP